MTEKRENDNIILKDLSEIKDSVNKLSIKMTTVETVLIGVEGSPGLCSIVQAHGKQIVKLSNWRFQLLGGAAVVSFVCLIFLKYVL